MLHGRGMRVHGLGLLSLPSEEEKEVTAVLTLQEAGGSCKVDTLIILTIFSSKTMKSTHLSVCWKLPYIRTGTGGQSTRGSISIFGGSNGGLPTNRNFLQAANLSYLSTLTVLDRIYTTGGVCILDICTRHSYPA